jgi:hypothetical protein
MTSVASAGRVFAAADRCAYDARRRSSPSEACSGYPFQIGNGLANLQKNQGDDGERRGGNNEDFEARHLVRHAIRHPSAANAIPAVPIRSDP